MKKLFGSILGILVLIAGLYFEFFGIYHSFSKHGIKDGLISVFIPPYGWYRAIEYWWHDDYAGIETMNHEWESLGPTTMLDGEKSYSGDFFYDRKSMERIEGKIKLWVRIKPHNPIVEQRGKETYRCDEIILRWIVDCGTKEVKIDYILLYWQGKEQYGKKRVNLKKPIMKHSNAHLIYEMFCF